MPQGHQSGDYGARNTDTKVGGKTNSSGFSGQCAALASRDKFDPGMPYLDLNRITRHVGKKFVEINTVGENSVSAEK